VALNIITLGAKPGMTEVLPPGLVDATQKLLVESGAVGRKVVRFSYSRMAVGIYRVFDWMMPGQFEAFGHRKAFCERQVRGGIGSGAKQVLVLGAGYDTIGWRLAPEFPEVEFFEIDHPATAEIKARGIEAMGRRDNLHLLAEDLGKRRLVDVLEEDESWCKTAPTVFVAEGLLMYLPPDAVEALLDQCSAGSGEGSRIIFSCVGTRKNGRPDAGPWSWLVLRILKIAGEPWLWCIQPDELGSFLLKRGWKIAPNLRSHSDKCGIEFFVVALK
jgi:methyltransferase (TIGR00027 family)